MTSFLLVIFSLFDHPFFCLAHVDPTLSQLPLPWTAPAFINPKSGARGGSRVMKTEAFFLNFILFIFLYSRFLLVIYFIHISVYMSVPISQFIPPPLPPRFSPPWCSYRKLKHLEESSSNRIMNSYWLGPWSGSWKGSCMPWGIIIGLTVTPLPVRALKYQLCACVPPPPHFSFSFSSL